MRYFILLLMSVCLFGADEPKSPSTLIYEKALSENARDASVAFESYWKALEVANAKVVRALEGAKADLNDSRKGSLSISDRAKAIMELDEKIKAVKEGAICDLLIANKRKVPIAATPTNVAASIMGKWTTQPIAGTPVTYEFYKRGGIVAGIPVEWKVKEGESDTYDIIFPKAQHNRVIKITTVGKEGQLTYGGETVKLIFSK